MIKKRVFLVTLGVAIVSVSVIFSSYKIGRGEKQNIQSVSGVLGINNIIKNTTKMIDQKKSENKINTNKKLNHAEKDLPAQPQQFSNKHKRLVWEEKFANYISTSPNAFFWNIAGSNLPVYNQEKQTYNNSSQNVRVESGNLVLEAHNTNNGIISGRVDTKGKVKISQGGRLEATIKLPKGKGVWPAFWLLSDNLPYTTPLNPTDVDWQKPRFYLLDGEIDIMEFYGNMPGVVESTVHTFQKSHENSVSLDDNIFHTYWVEWTEQGLVFGVDDIQITTYTANSNPQLWPFTVNNQMYIIFNLAMGGSGGGEIVNSSNDSWKMFISSVKYYRFD